jgi:purine catabolism regulator
MTVTVRQLLDLELIREKATLVAGAEGLDRVVTFVTIMEAPDFHEWVDGGEFILTTWYAFSQKPELQLRAFSQLADKIAAIGIKVERFVDKIPDEIVALAEEKQVPVLAIQRDTKFREVIQAIAGELNNYQANLLIEVDRHYQALAEPG